MFEGYYNEERLNSWKWKDISLESQIHEYLSIRDKTIEISINKINERKRNRLFLV